MYKLDLNCLYPAFVNSGKFAESLKGIPDESVKNAVFQHGIGDSLDRDSCGSIFYDFVSGNLIEAEVQDVLTSLSNEDYGENFKAIGEVAENYAEWAVAIEEKINRIFHLGNQIETLSAIDRQAKEYQALLLDHAQTMGYTLA